MICYLNIMYHFEEGLMADERKLNEQPSINKDYYYYYYYYNVWPASQTMGVHCPHGDRTLRMRVTNRRR